MPETIVMTFGMYVVSLKSPVGPTACQGCSCFSNSGPSAKPRAGRTKAAVATAPVTWTVPVMNRRRVIVSPSNAPGMPRSAVYFDLASLRSAMTGARNLAPRKSTTPAPRAGRFSGHPGGAAGQSAPRRAQRPRGVRGAVARRRLGRLQRAVRPPADRRRAGLPGGLGQLRSALGMRLRAERDDVRELGDGVEVPEGGEPREPERVEVVAGQQHEVAVLVVQEAAGRVVQQVALADRLDHERDVVATSLGPRAGRREGAELRVVRRRRRPRAVERLRQQAALVAQRRAQAAQGHVGRDAHESDANAAAAASTVRSTCSGPWASDGNHASNCDGGGETPRARSARHQAPNASRSQACAPARSTTGSDEKKTVSRPGAVTTCTGTDAAAAASRSPVASASVVLARRR